MFSLPGVLRALYRSAAACCGPVASGVLPIAADAESVFSLPGALRGPLCSSAAAYFGPTVSDVLPNAVDAESVFSLPGVLRGGFCRPAAAC
jgi:hypothetical protein